MSLASPSSLLRRLRLPAFATLAVWLLAAPLQAFPPNPSYTLFGMVRDQVGATLRVEGAVIVLLHNNTEVGRAPVRPTPLGDRNYEIDVRIDQARAATRTYSHKAVPSQGIYTLYVEMNGEKFYPIETKGTLRAGNGGERVRLDLNLGADTNHDGLPDAWQEFQLFQAGRRPGQPGWDIGLITKDGDFDGDGVSNFLEYVAGTFAGDAAERFELKLVSKSATEVGFEFYGITGKVYTIEESSDLRTWSPAPFALSPGGSTARFHRASVIGVIRGYVAAGAGTSRFYRLTVR